MTSCRAPGIPELFKTKAQFDAYSEALVRAGVMPDSSYIWWAIRPSLKHPTLELRAPDSCTRIEDSIAIASLYRSLVRRLSYNPWQNWDMNAVSRAIIVENKWRAQRYGVHGTFAAYRGRRAGDGRRHAGGRDLRGEERCRGSWLPGRGAALPAHRRGWHLGRLQIGIYDQFADNPEHALRQVADWLTETTLQ
jgi:carboxylate-amine ligase